jgi:gamma-glutamylcyclotransferase (GGCT)/AIG2-like uncharacterized protein YtfP
VRDSDYPATPYPGAWPGFSYLHWNGTVSRLYPDVSRFAGWRIGEEDLDDWLVRRYAPPLAARVPVLVYGSNRCPSKISWLRTELGLTGPVVVLAADTEGVTSVWAAGLRARDGQRPAVLSAAPGVRERHALWLATPDQLAVLDRCEGRGERYRLARLHQPARTEDGARYERPLSYLGLSSIRRPLLVDGDPVRCVDVPQSRARELVGRPAPDDGLGATDADDDGHGRPAPERWPAALFAYGLLQPGHEGWPLVAPHVGGQPRRASATGIVHDTGLGWPALLLGSGGRTEGTLIPLADPPAVMPALDDYEGPDYRRVRTTLGDGSLAWCYVWVGRALVP